MKLILGSASPYRKDILANAGFEFETMAADIDEKAIRHSDPRELVLLLARAKSDALLHTIQQQQDEGAREAAPALLITSDQVITCNGEIREKPVSAEQVREFYSSYGAHPAESVTAVVITNIVTKERNEGIDACHVYFRSIPEKVVEQIIHDKHAFNCAGGFHIEDPLIMPYVERIDGTINSIAGLPVELTVALLRRSGYTAHNI